jgi:hypothetical protein
MTLSLFLLKVRRFNYKALSFLIDMPSMESIIFLITVNNPLILAVFKSSV